MRTTLLRGQAITLVGATLLMAGGCSQSFTVVADKDISNKSVEVHLVGVGKLDKEVWEKQSMTDYWKPGNSLRASAGEYTQVIRFGPELKSEVALDPQIQKIWRKRHAESMFVLADLPTVFTDEPGNADKRRKEMPTPDSRFWAGKGPVVIKIQSGNIIVQTK